MADLSLRTEHTQTHATDLHPREQYPFWSTKHHGFARHHSVCAFRIRAREQIGIRRAQTRDGNQQHRQHGGHPRGRSGKFK